MEKRLFLLDAYALIFRAFYAFISRPIINSKGLNTSAIYGFVNSLLEIIQTEKPSHIAVAFDPPAPTFRKEIFEQYKANRDATPEEIKLAVPYIKKILEALNIPVFEKLGFEADDVIGTLAKVAEKQNFKTYMVTPDKDYLQLISENTFLYKPRKGGGDVEVVGVEDFREKFNLEDPVQFIDILGLMGDSSDNIPGAPGVGEKTALKLIQEFKTIDNIFSNVNNLKGKLKEKIADNIEQINLSKKLATIVCDVPLEFDEDKLNKFEINVDQLIPIFDELEFKTLKTRILNLLKPTTSDTPKKQDSPVQTSLFPEETNSVMETTSLTTLNDINYNYSIIKTVDEASKLAKDIIDCKYVCFDTETTGIDPLTAKIIGLSISIKENEAYYVPFNQPDIDGYKILKCLKEVLENENILKIGQNIKYDIQILDNEGVKISGEVFDTMIAHYLIQPELKHNMDYLAQVYLNYKTVKIESLIGEKGKNQKSMDTVPLDKISLYACEDSDVTYKLYKKLSEQIKSENLSSLSETIEMPLINVLSKIERNGVKLDTEFLNNYSKEMHEQINFITQEIYNLGGREFNIASPKQLGEILFDELKIVDNPKKTKTKQYSTNEEVLQSLVNKHGIIPKILKYRGLTKLVSTYIDVLPTLINSKTGKIHTSYNQAIAATGRLSSINPNLQNIPIREEEGREVRKAFIPGDENCLLLSADYSQIELRIMAHMSGDSGMIEDFKSNVDIHTATAAKIYKISPSDVSREQRGRAKTANFGIIYGISAFGLAQRLNISRAEAKELIDNYFRSYPEVNRYMNDAILNAKDKGYVTTLFGRKRHLPDINSRNAMVRGMAERNAINAPIQGTAADIIKIAMIKIQNQFEAKRLKSKMILQVHDELVFDVYDSELEDVKSIVVENMMNAAQLKVPLIVEYGTGNNWLEAH